MTDYRIWPVETGPAVSFQDGDPINNGTQFYVTAAAWLTHFRFWRHDQVGVHTARLYSTQDGLTGTLLAGPVTFVLSGLSAWQEVALPVPYALTPDVAYKVVIHSAGGQYVATGSYWNLNVRTNGLLVAPSSNLVANNSQGSFEYGAPAFPTKRFNSASYWADVVVTDVDPTPPPEPEEPGVTSPDRIILARPGSRTTTATAAARRITPSPARRHIGA